MVLSMTGYGKASSSFGTKKVTIEIRSLNSKSVDLNTRIPNGYKELDGIIRKRVGDRLNRGKIDFNVSLDEVGEENSAKINKSLATSYYNDLKGLATELGDSTDDLLAIVMRMPDVLGSEREELSESEKNWLMELTESAISQLVEFREKEGKELEHEFILQIENIRDLLNQVQQYEEERIKVIRERMRKALEDLESGVDENRFEQELIFYIEKLDVSEEKMRLGNHLDYFIETMKTPQPGKKLGFIAQEIGREINTLGSKSNHAEMQKLVIGMKDSLEKIKEQVLNTL